MMVAAIANILLVTRRESTQQDIPWKYVDNGEVMGPWKVGITLVFNFLSWCEQIILSGVNRTEQTLCINFLSLLKLALTTGQL